MCTPSCGMLPNTDHLAFQETTAGTAQNFLSSSGFCSSDTVLTSSSYSHSRTHLTAAWRCNSHTQVWRHQNAEQRNPGLAESLDRPKGASHFSTHSSSKQVFADSSFLKRFWVLLLGYTSIKLLTRAPWKISIHCGKSNLLFSSATASGWWSLLSLTLSR